LYRSRLRKVYWSSAPGWAKNRSAEQANRWYTGVVRRLLDLEHHPERHRLAFEDGLWPYQLRQIVFGLGRRPSHRELFVVRSADVVVLRVRHLAQAPLEETDV
jgi:hypothetical protein